MQCRAVLAAEQFQGVALNEITFFKVIEIFESHTTFKSLANFADIIFLVSEGCQLTVVNDFAITQDAHFRVSADLAFAYAAACDFSNLGSTENGEHIGLHRLLFPDIPVPAYP